MEHKNVVTAFLAAEGRILLLRRGEKVGTHKGKWAGVSGYLEKDEDPLQRAQTEIQEELGLSPEQINLVRAGEILRAFDERSETVWIVHPFLFETRSKVLQLDWENTEYRWIEPNQLAVFDTVPKLRETYERLRCNFQAVSSALSKTLAGVDEISQDKVHGASMLGHKAIELLSKVAETSEATNPTELFCDLMLAASRLRKAQPGMANIRNLIGSFLYKMDLKRDSLSLDELKQLIKSLAEEALVISRDASEDASRNSVAILPKQGSVLTHSYSSTVLRALELGMKSVREFTVYVTESYPGMEGKQLAAVLVRIGVPVKLVADSAVGSVISDVDLVLVGADSVLTDGSLLHKIGTKNIANLAYEQAIPLFSCCETTKFSTADFLGESVQSPGPLFDLTPHSYVSKFITETGPMEPREVHARIRLMLKEMYP